MEMAPRRSQDPGENQEGRVAGLDLGGPPSLKDDMLLAKGHDELTEVAGSLHQGQTFAPGFRHYKNFQSKEKTMTGAEASTAPRGAARLT